MDAPRHQPASEQQPPAPPANDAACTAAAENTRSVDDAGLAPPRAGLSGLLWAPLIALAAGTVGTFALYPIDGPLQRLLRGLYTHDAVGGDLRRTVETLQQFGDAGTSLLIAWAVYLLDPRQRARLLDWLAAVLAGLLIGNGLKMLIGRPRPRFGGDAETILGPFGAYPMGVRQLSDGTTEPRGVRHAWEFWQDISSDLWSIPSSHTLHACIAAAAMGFMYPGLRPMVITLACVVGLSRVLTNAHWPSDVAAGAGLGVAIGLVAMHGAVGRRLVSALVPAWRARLLPPAAGFDREGGGSGV